MNRHLNVDSESRFQISCFQIFSVITNKIKTLLYCHPQKMGTRSSCKIFNIFTLFSTTAEIGYIFLPIVPRGDVSHQSQMFSKRWSLLSISLIRQPFSSLKRMKLIIWMSSNLYVYTTRLITISTFFGGNSFRRQDVQNCKAICYYFHGNRVLNCDFQILF